MSCAEETRGPLEGALSLVALPQHATGCAPHHFGALPLREPLPLPFFPLPPLDLFLPCEALGQSADRWGPLQSRQRCAKLLGHWPEMHPASFQA